MMFICIIIWYVTTNGDEDTGSTVKTQLYKWWSLY